MERFSWGTPNVDDRGQLLRVSNCRACVHWHLQGWVTKEQRYGEGCALHYASFPHRTDCPDFCREPGSDDAEI